MVAYVYRTPTLPLHYGDNVKLKITTHLSGYPHPAQGAWVKQWLQMTGA